jgi:fucose permease
MCVFGLVLSLPGTVVGLEDAAAQFGLTLADRGALISTLFIGLLIGSIASGVVVDLLGHRTMLVSCMALIAASLPLLARVSSFGGAAAVLAALGVAGAGVNTAANALSSDLFPSQRGRRMNGLAIAVGLGGLGLPVATALTAGEIAWQSVVVAGGAVAGLVAIAGALASGPPRTVQAAGWAAVQDVLRQPRVFAFGIMILLGAGTEAAMAGWTSTFLGAQGYNQTTATWLLASHWLGLVVARLALSHRVDRDKAAATVLAALVGSASIAAFAAAPAGWLLLIGPFAIGLAIAIVVPTTLALAGERFSVNAGALFGMLLTLAQIGGMVVPGVVGVAAEWFGLKVGMSLVALNGVLIALVMRRVRAAPQ